MKQISLTRHHAAVRMIVMFVASVAASAAVSAAAAQKYTVTLIPTLGGSGNFGYGINTSGAVTGLSCLRGFRCAGHKNMHAFVYSNGATHDLGTLGGNDNYSIGLSINASGQVAGYSSNQRRVPGFPALAPQQIRGR